MCFVAARHLSSTMGRSVFTACSDKTPLFPEHSISEGLPATQRLQRVPFSRPCEPWTPETRWKRRSLPWGGKGFFPFKFLNFSSAVEVQTTEPRRLKRKATKEVTNQRTLSTAQLLLFHSHCMPVSLKWMAAHKPFFTKSTLCVKECVQLAKELACCLWTALPPLSLSLHSFTLFWGVGGLGPRCFLCPMIMGFLWNLYRNLSLTHAPFVHMIMLSHCCVGSPRERSRNTWSFRIREWISRTEKRFCSCPA